MNSKTIERLSRAGIGKQVSKRELGSGLPLVIMVEQAHGVLSCKVSTIRILRRLYLWEDISLVGVEGAGETLDRKHLSYFDDPTLMKRFCANLLLGGELGGVEYWLMADAPDAKAVGVEDIALYARMYARIKDTLGVGQQWTNRLLALSDALLNPTVGTVSEELLSFIRRVPHTGPRTDLGAMGLQGDIETLKAYADRLQISTADYPAIAGGMSGILAVASGNAGVTIPDLMCQLETLRRFILLKLTVTDTDHLYVDVRERLEVGSKLVSSQCSTAEATRAAGESWTSDALVEAMGVFLDKDAMADLRADGDGFERACRAGLEFYDLLAARSDAMASKLLEAMHEHRADVAVLICGGAHRDGVEAYLASRGVSSLVIQPTMVVTPSDQKSYRSSMLQEHGQSDADNEKADAFVAEMDEDLLSLLRETAEMAESEKKGASQLPSRMRLLVELTQGMPGAKRTEDRQEDEDPSKNIAHVRNEQLKAHRRIVAQVETELGANHEATIKAVVALARQLEKMEEFSEAENLYRRSIAARERASEPDNDDIVAAMSGLANILKRRGDYAGAELFSRRVLAAQKKSLGSDDPETLLTMNKLATSLQGKGDLGAAEVLFQQALTLCEQKLGADHQITLATANNLAGVLEQKGAFLRAEPLYRRSLAGLAKATVANSGMLGALQKVFRNYVSCLINLGKTEAEAQREAGVLLAQCGMNIEGFSEVNAEDSGRNDRVRRGTRSEMQSAWTLSSRGAVFGGLLGGVIWLIGHAVRKVLHAAPSNILHASIGGFIAGIVGGAVAGIVMRKGDSRGKVSVVSVTAVLGILGALFGALVGAGSLWFGAWWGYSVTGIALGATLGAAIGLVQRA